MIWVLSLAVLMMASSVVQSYLLKEPLAYLKEHQPDMFDRLGGGYAKGGGWYTFSFTVFLVSGQFRELVDDEVIRIKFTYAMWWLRIFYLLVAFGIALLLLV